MKTNQKGYVTLISVLIIGAVATASSISLLVLALTFSNTSFTLKQSYLAKALADSCTEKALEQINNSHDFSGTDELNFSQGTCNYTVTYSTNTSDIASTGIVENVLRKTSVTVNLESSPISINSWQEVADF